MKATGVVRRIDDLGRIVIPKEIRRNFKMNEGDSIEIFVDKNGIILKKYSMLDDMVDISNKMVNLVKKVFNKNILVTDKEKVIATTKEYNEYLGCDLVNSIKEKIENRNEFNSESINNIILKLDEKDFYFFVPIIANSDSVGSVILIGDSIDESDKNIVRFIASFLIKSIEE